MLSKGANINSLGHHNNTPLHDAAIHRQTEAVLFLIKQGADVHALDKGNESPLYNAAINSGKHTAQVLLDNGADLDLHIASMLDLTEYIEEVLSKNLIDVNACDPRDHYGRTALHWAARR